MEQFSDFAYIKNIDLGSKANMSYRLRSLFNEFILTKYGEAVQSISFSPMIGIVLVPESEYVSHLRKLVLEFYMEPQIAIEADDEEFFQKMLDGVIASMEEMVLPKDLNFAFLKEDFKSLQFDQVPQGRKII